MCASQRPLNDNLRDSLNESPLQWSSFYWDLCARTLARLGISCSVNSRGFGRLDVAPTESSTKSMTKIGLSPCFVSNIDPMSIDRDSSLIRF
jgi:hypothetical protein